MKEIGLEHCRLYPTLDPFSITSESMWGLLAAQKLHRQEMSRENKWRGKAWWPIKYRRSVFQVLSPALQGLRYLTYPTTPQLACVN